MELPPSEIVGTLDISRDTVLLPRTVDSVDHRSLMLMTRGGWLELPAVTYQRYWFKSHPHSIQGLSDIYTQQVS